MGENEEPEEQDEGFAPEPEEAPVDELPEKFRGKSLSDVVKAYQELERGSGKRAQRVVEQLTTAGYTVDDEGNVFAPPAVSAPQTTKGAEATNPPDFAEQWAERFYENPLAAIGEVLTTARSSWNQADAMREMAVTAKQTDPMFGKVQAAYRAALRQIPDFQLLDPQVAAQAFEGTYNMVVGQVTRQLAGQAANDPQGRAQVLEALGVAKPDSTEEAPKTDVTRSDMEMLRAVGVPKERMDEVVKRFTEGDENE